MTSGGARVLNRHSIHVVTIGLRATATLADLRSKLRELLVAAD